MKNIGFVMHQDGEWKLAPSYDITYPFDPYLPSMKFHKMNINGKSKNIELEDLLNIAKKVGIRNPKSIIEQVVDAVLNFEKLSNEFQISEKSKSAIWKDIIESTNKLKSISK